MDSRAGIGYAVIKNDHFPLEKFLKNIILLKKSCLKLKNKQLFFSNLMFLRKFFKGKLVNFKFLFTMFGLKNYHDYILSYASHSGMTYSNTSFRQIPFRKIFKNIKLLKKSCLKLKNKQLFFSNLMFLRNFFKGNLVKWKSEIKTHLYYFSSFYISFG